MTCVACKDGVGFDLPITMAFQPIVDLSRGTVFAHEALVRGANGEGAGYVLNQVSGTNKYGFDQLCRTTAIDLASQLELSQTGASLSINFLPNAVYEPRACIRATLAAAMRTGFPISNIIFEFTENESIETNHLLNILRAYRAMGFRTAIDDFGAGYAGLGLITKFQPDIVKLDMDLIRDIDTDRTKRIVVRNTLAMLRDLDILPVCEGVETQAECDVLQDFGVSLMQGYLFAAPVLAGLAEVQWPGATEQRTLDFQSVA